MPARACSSCGRPAEGDWCAACGQRQPRAGDFSLRRLAGEAREALTDADSRLWRSLVGIFRPGLLTRAYLDYQWQRYMPPLRLFLVASGVYFFLAWDPYFALNASQMQAAPDAAVPPQVKAIFADPAASDRMSDLTSVLKFLFVIPMGLWMALLMWGNRRPVGEHMVFSLHYTTADFVLFSLASPLLAFSPPAMATAVFNGILATVVLMLLAWAVIGVRRVYSRGWLSSVFRGLAIVAMDLVLSLLAAQLATSYVVLFPY
ncbi:hypothetical protein GCM10011521_07790 [Arenimonas soli]|uniref:DUF3667 domain-containing protein n=1 Tax=Arenimonas soli TaxID=2269504 RepID=A0ABQ1HE76_9GAMM|nr:DUF3667 domain-containing protein [Arenimonas soli]GGA72076.1 hypothetical protein GCM10011521_07790 [Arenimonas soli]